MEDLYMIYAINEGVTISKKPHGNFKAEATNLIDAINERIKDLKYIEGKLTLKGLVRTEKKLSDSKLYQDSLYDSYDRIKYCTSSKCKAKLNLEALGFNTINKFGNATFDAFRACGFTFIDRTIGNRILDMYTAYKRLNQDYYIVCDLQIEDYKKSGDNTEYIWISFKCADATDKTLKALKLNESTIFEGTSFI